MTTKAQHEELTDACYEGNLAQAKKLIKSGVSPDGMKKCQDGDRPIVYALGQGHFEIAEHLLQSGARLHYAATLLSVFIRDKKYSKWVDRILDEPAPSQSEDYQSALCVAIKLDKRKLAERLLALCPKPAKFTHDTSPLCEAIRSENEELALWLIENGFNHQTFPEKEHRPSVWCILMDASKVLEELIRLGESPMQTVNGRHSVFAGSPATYKRMKHVRNMQNERYEVFHEGTLLHVAAVAGSKKCAQVLLDAGSDPSVVDSEGHTPAMLAALGGKATKPVLEILPELEESDGSQLAADLLIRAISDGDAAAVHEAIDRGADVNAAVQFPHSAAWTPLTYAVSQGNFDVVRTLAEGGADVNQSDWTEAKKPSKSGIEFLYENGGVEVFNDIPSPIDRSPLGWAAFAGDLKCAEYLIQRDADVHATDALSMTALHVASMCDHPKMINLLLDEGLDSNALAFNKMTPLHFAAEANTKSAIEILLKRGADPTLLNSSGESPYLAAKEWGKPRAYRLLEPHTPVEFRKKKRKTRKTQPDWQWSADEFNRIIHRAKDDHDREAKKLTTKTFRNRLAKAAKTESFLESAEEIRKKLKADSVETSEDLPQIRWLADVKMSDAKLLRLQEDYLGRGMFVVRELGKANEKGLVYLVPTMEVMEVFGVFGTNGINMELDAQNLFAWIMSLHQRHSFRLVAVAHDGFELRLDQVVTDSDYLIREIMTVCPPEIDTSAAIKHLRKSFRSKTPRLFFWWD